jgi:adenosylcobinamide-phosphate synthase
MRCVYMAVAPLFLALLLDVWLGEPPNRYHPVAWMGGLINAAQRWAPRQGQWRPLAYGAGLVIGGTVLVACVGFLLERVLRHTPWPLGWLAAAIVLKLTFSLRGLARAAGQVQQALAANDLPQARHLVGWHLVSRDTTRLSASQVAAATVESVAENASDGVVAPLLYYALGGLPAALAYRFINTADAMLGYRDPVHEWLGKVPARLDDLVNFVPARLTAGLIVLAAPLLGGDVRQAWAVWRRDAHLTASPNAGRPMSAMAGALGVELEKVGHYRLGAGQTLPGAQDVARGLRLVYGAALLAVGLLAGIRLTLCGLSLWPLAM